MTKPIFPDRRTVLGVMGASAVSALLPGMEPRAHGAAPEVGETHPVILNVYSDEGDLLDFESLRALQGNEADGDDGGDDEEKAAAEQDYGYDDALLHSDLLYVTGYHCLREAENATARLDLPKNGSHTLTLSWPTSHGYSTLMADLPGAGTYDLEVLAARTLHNRQVERIAAGPAPDQTIVEARQETERLLARYDSPNTSAQEKRILTKQCLEQASKAQLMLDRALPVKTPRGACIAVTFTSPPAAGQTGTLLSAITGGKRKPAVRLVIEQESGGELEEMSEWVRVVEEIHKAGGLAVVQVCDSQQLKDLPIGDYQRRLDELIKNLAAADVWEVGNELGGEWLSDDATTLERVRLAADKVSGINNGGKTPDMMLTLYYQLGQSKESANSTFTWIKNNLVDNAKYRSLVERIKIFGLSIYPQHHPLGTAAERVMSTFEKTFPGKSVAITELGYGAEDLDDGAWWFGSPDDPAKARRIVAEHLTSVGMGRANSWGAPFWWYYLEDEAGSPDGRVSDVLAKVAAQGG